MKHALVFAFVFATACSTDGSGSAPAEDDVSTTGSVKFALPANRLVTATVTSTDCSYQQQVEIQWPNGGTGVFETAAAAAPDHRDAAYDSANPKTVVAALKSGTDKCDTTGLANLDVTVIVRDRESSADPWSFVALIRHAIDHANPVAVTTGTTRSSRSPGSRRHRAASGSRPSSRVQVVVPGSSRTLRSLRSGFPRAAKLLRSSRADDRRANGRGRARRARQHPVGSRCRRAAHRDRRVVT
jgi:hypothetical protein